MDNSLPVEQRSLYRRYRSRSFSDLIGQPHVTQTLRNAVSAARVGHAYVFTGPRGTGKTSTARILARAVNCLDPQDGEACNRCSACQATSGICLDIVEIDAASHGGVDDARDLRERAHFTPTVLQRKVYIIDEAHMLSQAANDALLKILEEPPSHVMFILATTDVHRVKATITSRCQRLDFRAISTREIVDRLGHVCSQEGIQADEAALDLIAQQSTGSLRDALSLLDQVRAYEGASIGMVEVENALGLARRETLGRLTDCILDGDAGGAIALIAELAAAGADMRQYARQLVQYWRDLLLICAGGPGVLGRTPDAKMAVQAALLSVPDATAILKAVLQPDYSGRRSASAQWQLELAVIEACQRFSPREATAGSASPVPTASTPSAEIMNDGDRRTTERSPRPPSPYTAMKPQSQAHEPTRTVTRSDGAVPVLPVASSDVAEPEKYGAAEGGEVSVATESTGDAGVATDAALSTQPQPDVQRGVDQIWTEVRRLLDDKPRIKAIMAKTSPRAFDGDELVLVTQTPLVADQLAKPATRAPIEDALKTVVGRAVSLRCVTINEAPASAGGTSFLPSETFVDKAARHLRAVHMERGSTR